MQKIIFNKIITDSISPRWPFREIRIPLCAKTVLVGWYREVSLWAMLFHRLRWRQARGGGEAEMRSFTNFPVVINNEELRDSNLIVWPTVEGPAADPNYFNACKFLINRLPVHSSSIAKTTHCLWPCPSSLYAINVGRYRSRAPKPTENSKTGSRLSRFFRQDMESNSGIFDSTN